MQNIFVLTDITELLICFPLEFLLLSFSYKIYLQSPQQFQFAIVFYAIFALERSEHRITDEAIQHPTFPIKIISRYQSVKMVLVTFGVSQSAMHS